MPVRKPDPDEKSVYTSRDSNVSSAGDALFIGVLLVSSFCLRFYCISEPSSVVFDEVHFGTSIKYYLKGKFFFDTIPPLMKLIYSSLAYLQTIDPDLVDFSKIGVSYHDSRVPYITLRAFSAFCGSLLVPLVFLIMRKLEISKTMSFFASTLILLDNAILTTSRFMLADAPLLLFMFLSVYFCVDAIGRSRKTGHAISLIETFHSSFWAGLSCSTRLIGFSTVFLVSFSLYVVQTKVLKRSFRLHLFICFAVPLTIYGSVHYWHLSILSNSGPEAAWMSPRFQHSLQTPLSFDTLEDITVDDDVMICSANSNYPVCLSSIVGLNYPQFHTEHKVSSSGQAIFGSSLADSQRNPELSSWRLVQADPQFSRFENGTRVRIFHPESSGYLIAHDVASPLTMTNMELSISGNSEDPLTTWKILVSDPGCYFVHENTSALLLDFQRNLPAWGRGQREINGLKHSKPELPTLKGVIWRVVLATDPQPVSNMPLLAKFIEHQRLFLKMSLLLDGDHPASSPALSWPLAPVVSRSISRAGILFWDDVSRSKGQIFMCGNPAIWLFCAIGVCLGLWILLARKKDPALSFLIFGWTVHYLPYLALGTRLLYIHYYFPSLVFSVCIFATVLEKIAPPSKLGGRLFLGTVILLVISCFLVLVPLTYGAKGSLELLKALEGKQGMGFMGAVLAAALGINL